MCKRSTTAPPGAMVRASYTGATRRLDHHAPIGRSRWRAAGRGGVPWWTLWLLWPLFGVFKVAVPAVWSGLAALSQVTVPLLPMVMVVVVMVLWRR